MAEVVGEWVARVRLCRGLESARQTDQYTPFFLKKKTLPSCLKPSSGRSFINLISSSFARTPEVKTPHLEFYLPILSSQPLGDT